MSPSLWVYATFLVIFLSALVIFVLFCWAVVRLTVQIVRFIVKHTVLTELIGRVAEHAYSRPRVEDEWIHSQQMAIADPLAVPWFSSEPPILIRRMVPALPHIRILLLDGTSIWYECTQSEYGELKDGDRVQVNVYSLGGWIFHVSDPTRLVA
jgi:hypothetical protein